MQTFKKVLLSAVSLLLCVAVVFAALFVYSDKLSVAMSQKQCEIPDGINYIFCGASQCEMTFIPDEIDRLLTDTKSFNVSAQGIRLRGRKEVLKNIITEKGGIKTVVLELAYDSFERNEGFTSYSDIVLKSHYRSALSKQYCMRYTYNRHLARYEIENVKSFLKGRTSKGSESSYKDGVAFGEDNKPLNRGYVAFESSDVTIPDNKLKETLNTEKYEGAFRDENAEIAKEIIAMCRENGVEVILVVVPLSNTFIWKHTSMEKFHDYLTDLSQSTGCALYDFNLLKDRYKLFSDADSFYNDEHMSYSGAKVFTEEYCWIINKANLGEDVSGLFYESYEQMEADSPYSKAIS